MQIWEKIVIVDKYKGLEKKKQSLDVSQNHNTLREI